MLGQLTRPSRGQPCDGAATEHVALVHGFLANRFMLAALSARLRGRGFTTTPWGYWNMGCSLLVHAERFARRLEDLDADPTIGRLHLLGHSMGCIITRAALTRYRPRKLGRFVMLAPPNHGSFVATATAPTLGKILRPIAELSTAEDSLVNSLPEPNDVDVGVIAAAWDALVSPESTRLEARHAHTVVPTFHSGLLYRRDAADLVVRFLTTGRFDSCPPD